MSSPKKNNQKLKELLDIHKSTLDLVAPKLFQFGCYNVKRTSFKSYPAYMYDKDINAFLEIKKVWVIFEDMEPLFLDFYDLCEIFKIKREISQFSDVSSPYQKEKICSSASLIQNIIRYCGITGYFDELYILLKEDQYKYYQIFDYGNWYLTVQESINDFHAQYLCKPEIIAANEETFRKIGYQGVTPENEKIKNFGDDINSVETVDIFPDLTFVFHDTIKDDQFVLVLEKDEGENDPIDNPINSVIFQKL